MLGSPYAENRWRAAHSIRCLAQFGQWDVIDVIVANIDETTAGPFQACELTFYFLHAKLWLLIALARVALDHPQEIVRYKAALLRFALEKSAPHVLVCHFSSSAIVTCMDAGTLVLSPIQEQQVRASNLSPHPRLEKKIRDGGDLYQGRADSAQKPDFEFHLDYDFHNHDVDNLSRIFGKPCWEVKDIISEIVQQIDPNVSSMYDDDGRRSPNQRTSSGMSTRYHGRGQQLGWHALFIAAGRLLNSFPVTNDWYYENDPWGEWLGRYVLTRSDGFWLSDGTDRKPLDTAGILLEKARAGLVLTGDRDKILHLAGVSSRIGKELVIDGRWHSADGIRVHISSALVALEQAVSLARKLMREVPIQRIAIMKRMVSI